MEAIVPIVKVPPDLTPARGISFVLHSVSVRVFGMARDATFQAFALGFPDGESSPPAVVARGEYASAEYMVSMARKHGIPVVEKPELCVALEPLPLDESIPQKLFEAAAALLVEIGVLRAKSGS